MSIHYENIVKEITSATWISIDKMLPPVGKKVRLKSSGGNKSGNLKIVNDGLYWEVDGRNYTLGSFPNWSSL